MFHKLAPRPYKKWVQDQLVFSGSKKSVNSFIDTAVILGIIVGVVGAFVIGG